jgi:hypothetical protein
MMTVLLRLRHEHLKLNILQFVLRDHLGRDHMVVGFTTTYAISAYHH